MPTNFETFQLVPVNVIAQDPLNQPNCRPSLIPDSSGWKYVNVQNNYPYMDALTGNNIPYIASNYFQPLENVDGSFADALPNAVRGPNTGIGPTGLLAASQLAGQGTIGVYTLSNVNPFAPFPYIYAIPLKGIWNPCALYLESGLSEVGFNAFDFTTHSSSPCGINQNLSGTWGAHMLGYRVYQGAFYVCVGIMDLQATATPASHIGIWKVPYGAAQWLLKQSDALYWQQGPMPPPVPSTWFDPIGTPCGSGGAKSPFSRTYQGGAYFMADAVHSLTWLGGGVTHGKVGFLIKSGQQWNLWTLKGMFTAPPSIQAWLDRYQASMAYQQLSAYYFSYVLTLQMVKGFPRLIVGYNPSLYYASWRPGTPTIFTTASWTVLDWENGAIAEYPYGSVIAQNPLFPLTGKNNYAGVALCGARENGVFCGLGAGTDGKGYYFEIHRTYAKGHSSTAYQFNLASLLKG